MSVNNIIPKKKKKIENDLIGVGKFFQLTANRARKELN